MFIPSEENATRLKKSISRDFLQSLASLSGNKLLSEKSKKILLDIAGSHTPNRVINPLCFIAYSAMFFSLLKEESTKANLYCNTLDTSQLYSDSLYAYKFSSVTCENIQQVAYDLLHLDSHVIFKNVPDSIINQFNQNNDIIIKGLLDFVPGFKQEIIDLIGSIYLIDVAFGPSEVGLKFFGSASSPLIFGGIFANTHSPIELVDQVELILHETAHTVLFALTQYDSLTKDDGALIYDSPLRDDPRSLEGVFHATWVSARLALFYHLNVSNPEPFFRSMTDNERLKFHLKAVNAGLKVLNSNSNILSAKGNELLDDMVGGLIGYNLISPKTIQ